MRHYVGVQLRSRLTVLTAAIRAMRRTPADAEAVHGFRVASRRFLQAIRLFREFLDPHDVRRMKSRLHRLVRHAGEVRNFDITARLLQSAGVRDSGLALELECARRSAQDRFERQLRRWKGDGSPRHWRPWLRPKTPKGTRWREALPTAENAHRVLPGMLRELFAAGADAAKSGEVLELHRFRLLGKHFRYSLELLGDVYGSDVEKHLRELRHLQDLLGAVNDIVVAMGQVSEHAEAEQGLKRLLETRRRAFLEFWKRFSKQQGSWEKWLGGGDHGALRSTSRRSRTA